MKQVTGVRGNPTQFHRASLLVAAMVAGTFVVASAKAACNSTGLWLTAQAPQRRLAVAAAGDPEQDRSPAWAQNQGSDTAQSSGGPDNGDHDPGSIVGLWHVFFVIGTTVFDEGFDQWNEGGTEVLNDNAQPMPANGSGNICLGVFKRTGPRTFRLRHPFWIVDATGTMAGSGVILEELALGNGGNSYAGRFEDITYDLNGKVTSDTTGLLRAERILPD